MPDDLTTPPFARGSISIRLYPHNELGAAAIVNELCDQARLALRPGFDGVMTSEHHGGFAGYMAQPLQMATFVLEESRIGWAAASPLLLPLRATALVAEEIAWLNARHPGRVGLGVAAGALPLDFDIAASRSGRCCPNLQGGAPSAGRHASRRGLGRAGRRSCPRRCSRNPVPVLSAAVSVTAAKRAAKCGAGILMEGMSSYRPTGDIDRGVRPSWRNRLEGPDPASLAGRRAADLVRHQRAVYDSYSGATSTFGDDQTIASTEPAEIVARLCALVEATKSDALNLRVHLPGIPPEAVRDQIEALGTEVVRPLKDGWPAL